MCVRVSLRVCVSQTRQLQVVSLPAALLGAVSLGQRPVQALRAAGTVASSQDFLCQVLVQVAFCLDYPGPGRVEPAELPVRSSRRACLGQSRRVVPDIEIQGSAPVQCGPARVG